MDKDSVPCVIGLFGRSGAGKSFVSRIFEQQGVPSVDTDAIYREMTSAPDDGVLSDCMAELVRNFGDGILADDKSLDRRALAAVVFADDGADKRAILNTVTHKYILEETDRRISRFAEDGAWAVIVDAPLLFESGYYKKCDHIVAAVAPEETLVERITERDHLDLKSAHRRLAAQLSDEEVRMRADFVIETDDSEENLKLKVSDVLSEIGRLQKGKN